jgi:23S rRNA pseudouridine1911/1915/1917 synthase
VSETNPTDTTPLIVSESFQGARVDHFLREVLHLSRARLSRLFASGEVTVDGKPAKKGQPVHPGQRVVIRSLPAASTSIAPDPEIDLRLVFVDEGLVAIDKPAGIPSHPLRPGERGTVASALVARFPECAEASEDAREGGLCHRLDIGTSGVLLAARNRTAWTQVRAAFTRQEVDKRYWALVTGPLADSGEIDLPLRHRSGHPDRVEPSDSEDAKAREARSSFRVLARAGEYALVEVRIYTGVLHQVRAHLAAMGSPVVGDALYGGRAESNLGRFFLHARSLQLRHPGRGSPLVVASPLPPELEKVLRERHLAAPATPPSP